MKKVLVAIIFLVAFKSVYSATVSMSDIESLWNENQSLKEELEYYKNNCYLGI